MSERLLHALSLAQDAEGAERAARELLPALRSRGEQPSAGGVVKAVSACLLEHCRSAEVMSLCAQCLASATATGSGTAAAAAIRLEGAYRGAVGALRHHHADARVVRDVCRALARPCSASAQTALAVLKERQAAEALSSAITHAARRGEGDAVDAALQLLAALTKHERCATRAAGAGEHALLLPAVRAAMAMASAQAHGASAGSGAVRWDTLGAAARVLKNMAKWDDSRAALLASADAARAMAELTRLLAASAVDGANPAAAKLTKRAYRALWLLAEGRLPPLPPCDAAWAASQWAHAQKAPAPEAAKLVSAESDFERAIFPEAAVSLPEVDGEQTAAQTVAHTAMALRAGGWAQLVAPPPPAASAPPLACAGAGAGAGADRFQGEGRRLAPMMMLHELRRIADAEDVHNELLYHNCDGGGDGGESGAGGGAGAGQGAAGGGGGGSNKAQALLRRELPRAIHEAHWGDLLGDLPLPTDFDAARGGALDAAGSESSEARGGWFACSDGGRGVADKGKLAGGGGMGGNKGGKGSEADAAPVVEMAVPASRGALPAMPATFPSAKAERSAGVPSARRSVIPPLSFESRFESGNLKRATRVHATEYDLMLAEDLNDPDNHCQWFYFAVAGMVPGISYKLNIINMGKKDSLFNDGLQPLVCPVFAAEQAGAVGDATPPWNWRRAGTQVCYYASPYRYRPRPGASAAAAALRKAAGRKPKRESTKGSSPPSCGSGLYVLTFTLTVAQPGRAPVAGELPDGATAVYVAANYPFTYSDLQRYLSVALSSEGRLTPARDVCRRTSLCRTLAGHQCDLLTITDFTASVVEMTERQYVVLSARVHPGETNASWMMKGVLDFLLGESKVALQLRRAYVFKIVPMLNPDGVVAGNQRCSLAGVDLNRCWASPARKKHPTIYFTKKMIECIVAARSMLMFCDLHGHSRKQDVFIFGCEAPASARGSAEKETATGAGAEGPENEKDKSPAYSAPPGTRERVLPFLLSRRSAAFSMQKCNFKVQKSKYCTARVVVARELGVGNSYTLEASMGGSNASHFRTADLEGVGKALCLALADATASDEQPLLAAVVEAVRRLATGAEVEADDDDGWTMRGGHRCEIGLRS